MDIAELSKVKTQILEALQHPEADEGLYFRNFFLLDDVDERPCVEAEEPLILDALKELIAEGRVRLGSDAPEPTFHIAR